MSVGVDWVRSLTGDNILRVMTYADDFAWSEVKTLCYSQLNLAGPSAVHFVDEGELDQQTEQLWPDFVGRVLGPGKLGSLARADSGIVPGVAGLGMATNKKNRRLAALLSMVVTAGISGQIPTLNLACSPAYLDSLARGLGAVFETAQRAYPAWPREDSDPEHTQRWAQAAASDCAATDATDATDATAASDCAAPDSEWQVEVQQLEAAVESGASDSSSIIARLQRKRTSQCVGDSQQEAASGSERLRASASASTGVQSGDAAVGRGVLKRLRAKREAEKATAPPLVPTGLHHSRSLRSLRSWHLQQRPESEPQKQIGSDAPSGLNLQQRPEVISMHVSEADQERRSKVLAASSLAASLAMAAVLRRRRRGRAGRPSWRPRKPRQRPPVPRLL